jgi:hypothetical protein
VPGETLTPRPDEVATPDDERVVELVDDEPLLPEQTRDDTDAGWGDRFDSNDRWLMDERPPHWD